MEVYSEKVIIRNRKKFRKDGRLYVGDRIRCSSVDEYIKLSEQIYRDFKMFTDFKKENGSIYVVVTEKDSLLNECKLLLEDILEDIRWIVDFILTAD